MDDRDALELAIYRALRGEVPPCVRAIVVAEMSPASVHLQVFHDGATTQPELAGFEAGVESELQQHLGDSSALRLRCTFLPSEQFEAVPAVVYDNPWFGADRAR